MRMSTRLRRVGGWARSLGWCACLRPPPATPRRSRSPTSSRPARTRAAPWRSDRRLHAADRGARTTRRCASRRICSAACCTSRPATGKRRSRTTARSSSSIPPTPWPTSIAATPTISWATTTCAIADYTEAIKLDPNDPDIFNNRGQAYDNKGEYDLAIADYTQSIRLDKDNPRAFFNRGLASPTRASTSAPSPISTRRSSWSPAMRRPMRLAAGAYEELGNEAAARGRLPQGAADRARPRGGQGGLERLRTDSRVPAPARSGRIRQQQNGRS